MTAHIPDHADRMATAAIQMVVTAIRARLNGVGAETLANLHAAVADRLREELADAARQFRDDIRLPDP